MPNIIRDGSPGLFRETNTVVSTVGPAVGAVTVNPSPSLSGALQVLDSSPGGDIAVELPPISGAGGVGIGFLIRVAPTLIVGNITVAPNGLETINGVGLVATLIIPNEETLYEAVSATNWLSNVLAIAP